MPRMSRRTMLHATGILTAATGMGVLKKSPIAAADGTGRMRMLGLDPGTKMYYRVHLEDAETSLTSEPVLGSFTTAPTQPGNIRLHWSGDVVGQGWGINPELGGMTGFATMAEREPDLFIHSGDTCYADGPVSDIVRLDDGRVWRNLTSPAKDKVAETLAEFRGQYAYNLMDDNYRAFNASVAQIVQWDDHETLNNWYPGEVLDDKRYTLKSVDTLAERAYRAFHEWQPLDEKMAVEGRVFRKIAYGPLLDIFVLDMRSFKDANPRAGSKADRDGHILGAAQEKWLIEGLRSSTATWKLVAADLPLGIVVPDGKSGDQEAVANGMPGAPSGRESELARILSAIKQVRGVVWLTADVHYTAAHHYSPERATFQNFTPFWEFVSGPLHAGAFGPNKMDDTFGPEVVYVHAPGEEHQNTSPLDGFQHFGEVDIDGDSRELTVRLMDTAGTVLWEKTLQP
ncbi:alkaline phosphatase [Corynebacterium heidelbergense]|uniref:Alkaline phosphatase n=2 Tax=Corynebacterium heidelbergense TaxID=2055947 RepID=A0A364V582_9CORY|nr:alkaline phosphatase [Corynebacterium heidelbergense]